LPAGFQVARLAARTGVIETGFDLSLPPMQGSVGAPLPRQLLAGEGALWMPVGGVLSRVAKFDPETGEELDRITLRNDRALSLSFAEGESSLWVLTFGGFVAISHTDEIYRI